MFHLRTQWMINVDMSIQVSVLNMAADCDFDESSVKRRHWDVNPEPHLNHVVCVLYHI